MWGEIAEDEKYNDGESTTSVMSKFVRLGETETNALNKGKRSVTIKIKNPLVTQTIEVMKQTEMLRSLIDTYSTKSGSSNYLVNSCHMIPEVDFPPENAADFVDNDEFTKPISFIPPLNTRFALGLPMHCSQINLQVCKTSLRKAVCSQLRVSSFTDAAKSALFLFVDGVEEFIKNYCMHIREIQSNIPELKTSPKITLESLEKAHFLVTNTSLFEVHNFWRNLLIRNRTEIAEYKSVFHEYDKLMKESQNMEKEDFQGSGFLNNLEMPQSNMAMISENNVQEAKIFQ